MSFYRAILAMFAAIVIATPVFAGDTATTTTMTEGTVASATEGSQPADAKINLNTATIKELIKVKGLNASKARAIVAYRKKHGNFTTVDSLSNVKGFKKLSTDELKAIEDQLTIE